MAVAVAVVVAVGVGVAVVVAVGVSEMPDYPPLFCGVDPGVSGGIAFIGEGVAEAFKMPETRKDLIELLEGYDGHVTRAYVEEVHAFPGNRAPCPVCHARGSQGVVSTFTFGKGYGEILGILAALRIPVIDVSPMKWKKALGLRFTAEDSKKDKKNGSKSLAQQWFPSLKITHAISEALLIAEYGRRLNGKA